MTNQVPGPPEEKSRARQFTETALEAATSSVPFAGGALAVLLAKAFSRTYEKRLRNWMEQLADVVQHLMDRVDDLDVEELANDDDFMDAVATATRSAERTSAKIKLQALQNALLNVGLGYAPDVDKRTIYLRYIDELTPSHLTLLRFLDGPTRWFDEHDLQWPNVYAGGLMAVVQVAFPAWATDESFLDTLAADLQARALIENPSLRAIMTARGLEAQRTTPKGRDFMQLITGPFTRTEPDGA